MRKHNQALKLNKTAVKCESLQDLLDCSDAFLLKFKSTHAFLSMYAKRGRQRWQDWREKDDDH